MSNWPGERYPSYYDVEIANEPLEAGFLETYRNALLASSVAEGNEDLMQTQLSNAYSTDRFTYPISILYAFPQPPPDERIESLTQMFLTCFANDDVVNSLSIPSRSPQATVPFFRMSLACLTCAALPDDMVTTDRRDMATRLFLAGNSLWNVILEVDNTEAHTPEGALSPMLLSMYGVLSADATVWNLVAQQLLPASSTIVRRLRIRDIGDMNQGVAAQVFDARRRWSLMEFMLLTSTLSALHMDIPIYFNSKDLGARQGSSATGFHQAYNRLLDGDSLPTESGGLHVSPLTFLLSILSDSITIYRSLGKLLGQTEPHSRTENISTSRDELAQAPHIPLSIPSEYDRMLGQLSRALDTWTELFAAGTSHKYLALYYFCRLFLTYPQVSSLPRLANYTPAVQTSPVSQNIKSVHDIFVSNETVDLAWTVLANVNLGMDSGETTCPMWYPIVVFFAGLAVWARTQQHSNSWNERSRSVQLVAFKVQLDRMQWPCSYEMAAVLDRLIRPA